MNLITEIDRAVLELPEDLQIIWMRFRPLVVVQEFERYPSAIGVRISKSWGNETYIRADIYHPSTNSPEGWSSVFVDDTALDVAKGITEFFRDRTQQHCTTESEAV